MCADDHHRFGRQPVREVGYIVERDRRATGVRLAGGDVVPCEMVIVGIGIIPAVEPLIATGAPSGNGVTVNEHCATPLPHVHVIGDCALHASCFARRPADPA